MAWSIRTRHRMGRAVGDERPRFSSRITHHDQPPYPHTLETRRPSLTYPISTVDRSFKRRKEDAMTAANESREPFGFLPFYLMRNASAMLDRGGSSIIRPLLA